MTALSSTRKRRTMLALLVGAVAVPAAGVLAVVGSKAVANYEAATNAGSGLPVVALPRTPTGLIASVNDDGELVGAAIAVLTPSGVGGAVVDVPVSVDTAGGVDGAWVSVRQAFDEQGAAAAESIVESVLAIEIDFSTVVDASSLAALFAPVEPISVQLADDVLTDRSTVVFEKGPHTLDAGDAAALLSARSSEQAERDRRPALDQFWQGFSAAVGGGKGAPAAGEVASFNALWANLLAGPVAVRTLPTQPVSAEQNPSAADVDVLDVPGALVVLANLAPDSLSAPQPGLRFRLQAPPGYESRVRELIGQIIYLQGNVISVSFDGPVQEKTEMFVYDGQDRAGLEGSNAILGDVKFPKPSSAIDGVDVAIVLGSEYLDAPPAPLPSTTQAPTSDAPSTDVPSTDAPSDTSGVTETTE